MECPTQPDQICLPCIGVAPHSLVPGLSLLELQSCVDTSAFINACWGKRALNRTVTNTRMPFILKLDSPLSNFTSVQLKKQSVTLVKFGQTLLTRDIVQERGDKGMNLQGWLLNSSFDFSRVVFEQNVKARWNSDARQAELFLLSVKKGSKFKSLFQFCKVLFKRERTLVFVIWYYTIVPKSCSKKQFQRNMPRFRFCCEPLNIQKFFLSLIQSYRSCTDFQGQMHIFRTLTLQN